MPLYDYKCETCGHITESLEKINFPHVNIKCEECNHTAFRIFSPTKFIPFKPYTEYNLGDIPIEITSKKQLDNELKKRGLAMDNRAAGVDFSRRRRTELKKKAEKAKEYINATTQGNI